MNPSLMLSSGHEIFKDYYNNLFFLLYRVTLGPGDHRELQEMWVQLIIDVNISVFYTYKKIKVFIFFNSLI